MKKVTLLAVACAAWCIWAACSQQKNTAQLADTEPEEEPLPERFENDDLPKAADELFEDFMYYFASNERLQRRRIAFPIESVSADDSITTIEADEWQMDPFFMDAGMYTLILDTSEERELQNDTTVQQVVVEKIFLVTDSVCQYLFNKVGGRWTLTGLRQQRMADNANAPFLEFYERFANDSAFQQKSLSKVIAFSGPDPEDDFAQMDGFITPDSWEAFAPELPGDSIYNIVYKEQKRRSRLKTVLICGISNGYEAELTFELKKGRWKLTRLTE